MHSSLPRAMGVARVETHMMPTLRIKSCIFWLAKPILLAESERKVASFNAACAVVSEHGLALGYPVPCGV